MNQTIIHFVRHGEVYNPNNILYGRLPGFHLSKAGRRKIKKLARKFNNKEKEIKFIYTSPMLRTRQTAEILSCLLFLKPRVSKMINEVDLIFAGINLDQFRKKMQQHIYEKKYIRMGQESITEIAERMVKFTNRVKKKHQGEEGIVVSHGDPIVILKAEILGKPFTNGFKKKNYIQPGEFFTLICRRNKYLWK